MGKLKKSARCAAVLFSLTLGTGCVYYQAQGYNTGDWKPPEERQFYGISYDPPPQEEQNRTDKQNQQMMSSSKSFVMQPMPMPESIQLQYGAVEEPESPIEPNKKLLISGTKAPFPGVVDGPNPFLKESVPKKPVEEAYRVVLPWDALKEEERRRLFMSGSKSSPFRSPPAQREQSQQE